MVCVTRYGEVFGVNVLRELLLGWYCMAAYVEGVDGDVPALEESWA